MRLWIAAVLLLQNGCATAARLTIGPTIDTFGNIGGEIKVTLGAGLSPTLLEPTIGVGSVAREGATAVIVKPELTYWFEPSLAGSARRMPAFRGGLFYSGRFFWIDGSEQRLDGVGFNFAILPRIYSTLPRDLQIEMAGDSRFVHLGVEVSGEYVWGSSGVKDRGIFSLGLTTDFSAYRALAD